MAEAIEISPGYVVVDLSHVQAAAVTVADLRASFDESSAQLELAEMTPEELLGDLDLGPI